jgi:hypothetical protein
VAAYGLGVALVALAGLWAGGVFRVKTTDGTIVVQVNEPDADVFIDGERITVTRQGDEPIEIRKPAGKHTLEVKKGGFKVESRELTLTAGGREPVTVRLERASEPQKPGQPSNIPKGHPYQLDPRGKWKGWEAGAHARRVIWLDRDGWHFRHTNHRQSDLRHHIVCSIRVVDGIIEAVNPILPKGYATGQITLNEDKNLLTVEINTKDGGREAGIDFKVSRGARQLDIELNKVPESIYIGFHGMNPPWRTFSLPAIDPE